MITVYINRKPYMASLTTSSHLASVTLKGQIKGHSDFEALYLAKKQCWTICYY